MSAVRLFIRVPYSVSDYLVCMRAVLWKIMSYGVMFYIRIHDRLIYDAFHGVGKHRRETAHLRNARDTPLAHS